MVNFLLYLNRRIFVMMIKVFSLPDRIFKFPVFQLCAGKNYINKIWLKKASLSFYVCIEEDYEAVGS